MNESPDIYKYTKAFALRYRRRNATSYGAGSLYH